MNEGKNYKKLTNDGEYMGAVIALSLLLAGHPNRDKITSLILSISHYIGETAEREGRDKAELDAL